MLVFHKIILFLFLWLHSTIADVSVSKPIDDQTYTASGGSVDVQVSWIESSTTPLLTTIEEYTFTLCSGPNSEIDPVTTLAKMKASDITDYTVTLPIEASVGANGYYYIQIYAVLSTGSTIHYTRRFNLMGMTGTYEPVVGAVLTPPSAQTSLDDGNGAATINTASFTIPYTEQTGISRFAPMQTQPEGSVTKAKSSWSRRYPSSSVSYFSTLRSDLLKQQTTITQGWSYIISSAPNWATPALFPSENGGWYNPSSRIQTPTMMAAAVTHTESSETSATS